MTLMNLGVEEMMRTILAKHKCKIITALLWTPVMVSAMLAAYAAYIQSDMWVLWLFLLCASGFILFLIKPWEQPNDIE